jgi:hypothetical protein
MSSRPGWATNSKTLSQEKKRKQKQKRIVPGTELAVLLWHSFL